MGKLGRIRLGTLVHFTTATVPQPFPAFSTVGIVTNVYPNEFDGSQLEFLVLWADTGTTTAELVNDAFTSETMSVLVY